MPRRCRGPALLVGLLAIILPPTPAPAAPAPASGGASIELAAQTPVVSAGGAFAMRLRLDGVPADGSIRVGLHQRVRSRSELDVSRSGDGLRSEVFETVTPLDALADQADGTRRLVLSLDPATGGVPLRIEGVYPVEVVAQDVTGAELARLVTHLVMAPEAGDDAPPLGVAVVAEVDAPPALQPDGSTHISRGDVEDLAAVIAGLSAVDDVPVTTAARPETIDGLASSGEPGDAELVDALRAGLAGRAVLRLPYANASPDDLAPTGLLGELGQQLDRGREVLIDALGVEPTGSVWLASADLGAAGLAALTLTGVRRVVVDADQVQALDPGLISYSLAQPFLLTAPVGDPPATVELEPLEAMATDPTVQQHLRTAASDGLVASRVLSELAFLRLEQPSLARSMVVPLAAGVAPGVVQLVLEGLGAGRPFAPMGLDEAFDHAAPLVDGGGNQVDRPLEAVATTPIREPEATSLQAARAELGTFAGLVGAESPRTEPLERHLLLATAEGLTATERRAHIATVTTTIDAMAGTISTPATFALTLTAREGTIPLTIRNDSGEPLHVSVRLRSQKLEFPDGDTIERVLTEETTRIDIAVRARASGAFPLEVNVTTPDGRRSLSMTRYTVRSTVVSGVGLILSGGAGLFLVVWWARHWRRTRRSAKLVALDGHPAAS